MPEAVQGHLADDRDRRRVQDVDGLEADEGRADQDPALLVDDEAASARFALAEKLPPAVLPSSVSIARAFIPSSFAASSVLPTAATWGSVKVTCGEPRRSSVAATSRPRMWSATTRAWYLPMWVSSTRPLRSPIA